MPPVPGLAHYREDVRQASAVPYTYPMREDDKAALAAAQGGRCAVCSKIRPLVPDHDHSTGVVRGMLCRSCNTGIGNLGDDLAGVWAALDYLLGQPDAPAVVRTDSNSACGHLLRTMRRTGREVRCSEVGRYTGGRCWRHIGA